MDMTWTWADVAPAKSGGRALPNHVRATLLTFALGAGMTFGQLVRLLA